MYLRQKVDYFASPISSCAETKSLISSHPVTVLVRKNIASILGLWSVNQGSPNRKGIHHLNIDLNSFTTIPVITKGSLWFEIFLLLRNKGKLWCHSINSVWKMDRTSDYVVNNNDFSSSNQQWQQNNTTIIWWPPICGNMSEMHAFWVCFLSNSFCISNLDFCAHLYWNLQHWQFRGTKVIPENKAQWIGHKVNWIQNFELHAWLGSMYRSLRKKLCNHTLKHTSVFEAKGFFQQCASPIVLSCAETKSLISLYQMQVSAHQYNIDSSALSWAVEPRESLITQGIQWKLPLIQRYSL